METVDYNFHDEDGRVFRNIILNAGDDARMVKWLSIDENELKLYANHKYLIRQVAKIKNNKKKPIIIYIYILLNHYHFIISSFYINNIY
jgi:hypothetical protein